MTKNERFKEVVSSLKFYNKCTQKALASKLDVTPSYLSDIVAGRWEVSDSLVDKLVSVFPSVNRDYIDSGVGSALLRVPDSSSVNAKNHEQNPNDEKSEYLGFSTEDSVTIPSSAWKVIELQAESLAEKDRQTSRCIAMLEQSFELIKRGGVRVADAASADAESSAVG